MFVLQVAGHVLRDTNVAALRSFATPAQQDDQYCTSLDKINPVTWADVDTKLTNALADGTNVAWGAKSKTLDPGGNAGTCNTIA